MQEQKQEQKTGDVNLVETKNLEPEYTLYETRDEWKKYPSPNSEYVFAITGTSDKNTCPYTVLDSVETEIDISFISSDTVLCGFSEHGGLFDGFDRWLDGNSFIFSPNPASKNVHSPSNMHIVDLDNKSETIYEPPSGYLFVLYIPEFEYWVYAKGPNRSMSILDVHNNTVKDMSWDFKIALYDEINQGIVFLGRRESDAGQSFVVSFVDLNTLETRTILETEPIEVPGRGCSGWGTLDSIRGEVRLNPGSGACYYHSAASYIDETDGLIHIQL